MPTIFTIRPMFPAKVKIGGYQQPSQYSLLNANYLENGSWLETEWAVSTRTQEITLVEHNLESKSTPFIDSTK